MATLDEIAAHAARLLVDGEALTFGEAKSKAAADIGLGRRARLPDNLSLHIALAEHQVLFCRDHESVIRSRRSKALAMLERVREFEPRLVGPILYGTACDISPVTIHLWLDEPESFLRYLISREVRYEESEISYLIDRHSTKAFPSFEVEFDEEYFEFVVLAGLPPRVIPRSPLDGKPYRQVDEAGLREILDKDELFVGDHLAHLNRSLNIGHE